MSESEKGLDLEGDCHVNKIGRKRQTNFPRLVLK